MEETQSWRHAEVLWLEVPLVAVGRGEDFQHWDDLAQGVVVNRFQGLALALNSKHGFAALANTAERAVGLNFPETLVLPTEERVIRQRIRQGELWLWKPGFGGAGKGIELVQGGQAIEFAHRAPGVLQRYIERPMLVNGYRFTIRLYALILRVRDPLKVLLNRRYGIAKFTTVPFGNGTDVQGAVLMQSAYRQHDGHEDHKERSAVRGSCNNEGHCVGTRWDLVGLLSHLDAVGPPGNSNRTWANICRVVRAAIETATKDKSVIQRDTSFQVLGVDLDLDSDGTPFFIEANVTPALGHQTEWEALQKEKLLAAIEGKVFRQVDDDDDSFVELEPNPVA